MDINALFPVGASTLTLTPATEAANIQLAENSSGVITSAAQSGVINFSDTDTSTLPTGSIKNQTVTVTNGSGSDVVTANVPSGFVDHKVARFRQVDMNNPRAHHDALEFPNGEIVKVTRLIAGQAAISASPACAAIDRG